MADWYDIKTWLRWKLIKLAILAIENIESVKNEALSRELHRIADHYARRPTGQWE